MQRTSVMTRCTASTKELIGPQVSENQIVTGDTYKRLLRHYAFPKLQEDPEDTNLQQDGARMCLFVAVRQNLDMDYLNLDMRSAGQAQGLAGHRTRSSVTTFQVDI